MALSCISFDIFDFEKYCYLEILVRSLKVIETVTIW